MTLDETLQAAIRAVEDAERYGAGNWPDLRRNLAKHSRAVADGVQGTHETKGNDRA